MSDQESADAEHVRMTGGVRLLEDDPNDYLAAITVSVAADRRIQVSRRLIVEVVMKGLTSPGTALFEAASRADYQRTAQVLVARLDRTDLSSLIEPALREDAGV